MQKDTIATHFGYDQKSGFGTMAVPIYQSTAFDFGSGEVASNRFSLKELGPIYSRLSNPTVDVFEARMAALENGKAAIATASGQSAVFSAIVNLAQCGDNIIISPKIYSWALLTQTLKRFGILVKLFDPEGVEDLEDKIDEKTRAIFFETLSNPQISVSNTEKIVQIADKYGVVTIADNTVATPALLNPLDKGVDVVVHSASKYISGQGVVLGGVVVSSNNLNSKLKSNKRYPLFNEPDESYHGLVYADLVENFDIYTLRMRLVVLRDIGACLPAFSAFMLIQGLETLSIRMKKHSENTLAIAEFLEKHPRVKSVNYPGLKSSKANKYVSENFKNALASGMLSFEVESREFAAKVINAVKIFSVVVNIGDSKSLITHPASTTHSQLSSEELINAGVPEGLIRLSIGLEDANDLIEDLREALK